MDKNTSLIYMLSTRDTSALKTQHRLKVKGERYSMQMETEKTWGSFTILDKMDFFFLAALEWLVGSYFLDQRLNPCPLQ